MFKRHRNLRKSAGIRKLVRDVYISADDLVYPLFLEEGTGIRTEISSMPGQYRLSLDMLDAELDTLNELGVNSVLLFGIPLEKDPFGKEAYNDTGIVQEGVRQIKRHSPDMVVITDVCMCEYTSHGHCGIIDESGVINDTTIEYIAKIALSHAKAGADIVAPSDMMDGRIKAIRDILDENGFNELAIMSYSVKYASSFYGPFREAADSAPAHGDRKQYQMDYRFSIDAVSEARSDIEEGADIVIVKPALSYLDVIRKIRDTFEVPVAAYSVSGEYAMIKAGALNGWIDEKNIVMEKTYAMKRAGANIIITYFAKDIARWIKEDK
ncbi:MULTISPECIES: porphobilinogen synthase [Psychrilyobacter]|uniref:Delta-aminolevulinic acid dehydratase n=1 Tax=Psychrilyobacter piezotolerans TaxID=2293438 RepID=A0ABX9KI41_9FUSO|nr:MULTISPECIES: porphobilinogen synthase [Psychrilyobacter]MCS5421665.1 porphobilinogen synthase [Psychrilyobacter sp. S5]NDI77233.1 porphobilinogen synthase [Psychrilyobacter piezotolerans]RDE63291.1 porphobilinogen synthase [Psychrilyobacter sp. S5]REI41833.1 porphobilinogen synthase [Psychrilyobacter piezotolerans]